MSATTKVEVRRRVGWCRTTVDVMRDLMARHELAAMPRHIGKANTHEAITVAEKRLRERWHDKSTSQELPERWDGLS